MAKIKDSIPPRLRGYLINNTTGDRVEVTDDVMNWRQLSIKYERENFSGVFKSVSIPIEICRAGREIIRDAFYLSGLAMDMSFEIMRRELKGLSYTRTHIMRLNAATYREHRDYIAIDGSPLTFETLVNSVGKTKYDIPVSETVYQFWRYRHNSVFVKGDWEIGNAPQTISGSIPTGSIIGDLPGAARLQTLSIYLNDGKMPFNAVENDFRSQTVSNVPFEGTVDDVVNGRFQRLPDDYFFEVDPRLESPDGNFTFRLRFKFRLQWDAIALPEEPTYSPRFFLYYRSDITPLDPNTPQQGAIINNLLSHVPATPITRMNWIDFDFNQYLTLPRGARLYMMVFLDGFQNSSYDVEILNFEHFNIEYIDKTKTAHDIPVVTPTALANALLTKMANGDSVRHYTAEIDYDSDNRYSFAHYLAAAESIRGFDNANFHTSFNDFSAYMQFLGFEREVDEDNRQIWFRKRSYFFNPNAEVMRLTEDEVANVVIQADDSHAYSTLRIGYEKPDIDNTNGRFAVCGAFDYSTDYENTSTLRDSSLEIICPYKADPIEIETLTWTRGEKTTDKRVDNDVFMLAGSVFNGELVEDRKAQYMVEDTDLGESIGWYNVPYIPYYIVRRNESRIGVAVKNLTFAGTDSYREAEITGVVVDDVYSDIALTGGLFKPINFEFDAGTFKGLPPMNERHYLIAFRWRGRLYEGFIKELVETPAAIKGESWLLHAYTL